MEKIEKSFFIIKKSIEQKTGEQHTACTPPFPFINLYEKIIYSAIQIDTRFLSFSANG